MAKRIAVIIMSLLIAGCAVDQKAGAPMQTIMDQHIPGSAFDKTEQGYYTAELVLKPRNPVVGAGAGHLIVHNHEAVDTPGLNIRAMLYMSETGLESSKKPVVKDVKKGLYKVSDLHYDVPGVWKLKLEISGPMGSDVVVLSLPEVKKTSDAAPGEDAPIFGIE